MRNINVTPVPLTDLIYGILGLTFLRHKAEGFTRIAWDQVYVGIKVLSEQHPKYFPNVYFTDRGNLAHSKQVEDALSRLGGVLDVRNPRCQYLSFNENELGYVEAKLKKWFTPEKRKIIEKLAEEFYQKVKEDNT